MADFDQLAAVHRAAVKTAIAAGRALNDARHRYQAAANFGVPAHRLAQLEAEVDRAAALSADADREAEQANAAATAANPKAEVTR